MRVGGGNALRLFGAVTVGIEGEEVIEGDGVQHDEGDEEDAGQPT